MKNLIIIFLILFTSISYAANSRTGNTDDNTKYYEEATVDTDPGTDGYATYSVSLGNTPNAIQLEFYISAITGATIHLQWKRSADSTWTDYDSYTTATRVAIISRSKDIFWRGIVKDNNQGTTSTFGIDWAK